MGVGRKLSAVDGERIFRGMSERKDITLHTQAEVDIIRQRVNTTLVDMVDRTVQSMDRMSRRLDEVDRRMEEVCDVSKMTQNELMAYTAYMRESFRMKQDFLRTLSGYDMDVSRVPVQAVAADVYDEEHAEALRAEVLRREERR